MSSETEASLCSNQKHLLMATAASHSEILGLGPLGQGDCEVCRDSTPGESSVDFWRVSGRLEVTVEQLLMLFWSLQLALHMAWGM